MNNDAGKLTMPNGRPSDPNDGEAAAGLSIMPYVWRVWSYRREVGLIVAVAAVLCVIGGMALYLWTPVERTGSIQVRLLFNGAADGKYPNGTPFSSAELISTPVLTEVYRMDGLSEYGDFSRFKDAMVVLHSNPELQMIDEAYSAKLSDPKLTATERSRTEEEFRKKRESIVDPIYSLSIRRVERLRSMPSELVEKVLNDTLATWAKQADAKGAIRYNVIALSRNILQPTILKDEDYLVAIDVLRVQIRRVLDTITQIGSLPGAQTFRTGKEGISLAEVQTNLQDVLQLQLDPLMSLIKSEGLARDPHVLRVYIDGRLSDLNLDKERAKAVMAAVQSVFQNYTKSTAQEGTATSGRVANSDTTLMPQLSGDFLDRLMALSKPQDTDAAYRQRLSDQIVTEATTLASIDREVSYYQSLTAAIRTVRPQSASGGIQTIIDTRSAKALDEIGLAIDRVMAIYQGLSAQNLNPSTILYTVTTPFSLQTVRSLTLTTIEGFSVLIILLAFIGACAGCLAYDLFVTRSTPAAA